jgi:hypothetical protein
MGNPKPKIENLRPTPRSDDTTEPLAHAGLMARVPVDIDAAVRSLPNRSAWLRRVITEAAQQELMKDDVLHCPEPVEGSLSKDGGHDL